jgi:hypothetical protein
MTEKKESGREKPVEGLVDGKALVLPAKMALEIEGVLVSPLGSVSQHGKDRIFTDFSYPSGEEERKKGTSKHGGKKGRRKGGSEATRPVCMNEASDFGEAAICECAGVAQSVIERAVAIRATLGTSARIVAAKVDVKGAFRHWKLDLGVIEVFCYMIEQWLVIDLNLPFGWCNSPGWWQLAANGIQQAYRSLNEDYHPTEEALQWAEKMPLLTDKAGRRRKEVDKSKLVMELPMDGFKPKDKFWVNFYVDDGMPLEIVWEDNRRIK